MKDGTEIRPRLTEKGANVSIPLDWACQSPHHYHMFGCACSSDGDFFLLCQAWIYVIQQNSENSETIYVLRTVAAQTPARM